MVGNGKFQPAELEQVGAADVHVMGPEPFIDAVVGQFVDTDKKWVGPFGDLKGIADMISVSMGQHNEIRTHLSRLDR